MVWVFLNGYQGGVSLVIVANKNLVGVIGFQIRSIILLHVKTGYFWCDYVPLFFRNVNLVWDDVTVLYCKYSRRIFLRMVFLSLLLLKLSFLSWLLRSYVELLFLWNMYNLLWFLGDYLFDLILFISSVYILLLFDTIYLYSSRISSCILLISWTDFLLLFL